MMVEQLAYHGLCVAPTVAMSANTKKENSRDLPNLSRLTEPYLKPGWIKITLSDAELDRACRIARDRHKSYEAGATANTVYGDEPSFLKMYQGAKAELAIVKLFDEAEMDTSISVQGDDGTDTELILDGDRQTVDVKSTRHVENPKMLLKTGYDHGNADAYVQTAFETKSPEIYVVGWATKEELCQEDNLARWPYDHLNYVLDERNLRRVPDPDTNDNRVVK
jgi:hypothetical protein